jgi:hypothetical protein
MYLRVSPYQEIIEGIITALEVNEGIIKLTGRAGSGKSSLCKQLFQHIESQKHKVLYFSNPPRSANDLQLQISVFLGLNTQSSFTKTLTAYLLSRNSGERRLYLIFDEAQDIDEQTLNAIRMLCNVQDEHLALVKTVLCGSEDLNQKLSASTYRSLTQYLSQSFTLLPMSIEQLKDFYWAFWVSQNIEIQPPATKLIAALFKQTLGKPGPLLQKLQEARDSILDNQHVRLDQASKHQVGRRTGLQVDRSDQRRKNGSKAANMLAMMFGCLLLVIGAVMYILYINVDTPTLMIANVPAASPAVSSPAAASPATASSTTASSATATATASSATLEPKAPAPESATPVQITTSLDPAPGSESGMQMVARGSNELATTSDTGGVDDEVSTIASSNEAVEQAVAEVPQVAAEATVAESAQQVVSLLLTDWSSRWQDKDVDGYLDFYHPDFSSAGGDTLEVWQLQRRNSINRASDIHINYDNLEILDEASDTILVEFWLRYSSSTYGDDTLKQLLLLNTPAGWRIRSESNLRVERTK